MTITVQTREITPATGRLRDLNDEEFLAKYRCGRFTATVLSNKLNYIAGHMCAQMLTTAFSPILRDFYDFAAVLTGPAEEGYPTPAVSQSIIFFTGTMPDAVRNTVQEYGPERLQPGDVLFANDPYRGGTHVNDVLFTRPVFHQGKIASFVSIKAHQLDIGGVVPGGFSATKRNVYDSGLVISPRLLYSKGEPVQESFSMVFDNARFGDLLLPDIRSIYANLELGERLLLETYERYGTDQVNGASRYVIDANAERMEDALEELPEGEWEGEATMDSDGEADDEEYRIRVRITKRGRRAEVDLSGSSRQARTSINGSVLDAKTALGTAFKFLLDPEGPFTSGSTRPIDMVLPEGTVISALPPDGATFCYWEASQCMLSAMFMALSQPLEARAIAGDSGTSNIHNGSGIHPNGQPWVSVAQCGGEQGPLGASDAGDGETFSSPLQANGLAPSIEAIEFDHPVAVLRREPVPDSGGPGAHRGGASVAKDSLWFQETDHNSISLRSKYASGFGVYGGGDGKTGGTWIFDNDSGSARGRATLLPLTADAYTTSTPVNGRLDPETKAPDPAGTYFWFGRNPTWRSSPRSLLRVINNGGGGWGNPLERDPEKVKIDVRDGYVTVEGALRDYGVVVAGDPDTDPENLIVDGDATSAARAERATFQ